MPAHLSLSIPPVFYSDCALVREDPPQHILIELESGRTAILADARRLARSRDYEALADLIREGGRDHSPIELTVLRAERGDGVTLVVCAEAPENSGTTLPNAWPVLADVLVLRLGLDPLRTRFIERNDCEERAYREVDLAWSERGARLVGWTSVSSERMQRKSLPLTALRAASLGEATTY